jgi:hypothetical protein
MKNITTLIRMYDACNMEGNDERLILYDWLADSATTSHIMHQHEAFTSYTPWRTCRSITGVGGKEVLIAGRGTVELSSTCNGQQYTLLLLNVLHMPRTQNNLLLLGRWDAAGGNYFGGKGSITLVTKDGRHVAGRMPGLATYTEADRKDRIKLSSLHGSGNVSYYKSGL